MSAQTNRFTRAAKIAKKLYKTGRYKKYSDAVSAAFKQIGSGRKRSAKKKPSGSRRKKVSGVKTVSRSHVDKNKITNNFQIGTVAGHMASAKKLLATKIAVCELQKFKAVSKRVKRHYARMIADYKKAYRKLS